jgi:hypothetical protein
MSKFSTTVCGLRQRTTDTSWERPIAPVHRFRFLCCEAYIEIRLPLSIVGAPQVVRDGGATMLRGSRISM